MERKDCERVEHGLIHAYSEGETGHEALQAAVESVYEQVRKVIKDLRSELEEQGWKGVRVESQYDGISHQVHPFSATDEPYSATVVAPVAYLAWGHKED